MSIEKLKIQLNNLVSILEEEISLSKYREVAWLFQKLVLTSIEDILKKHNNVLNLSINDIQIGSTGSVVNTSTAYGFIIEEFIVKQLPDFFIRSSLSTNNSAEDFMYENSEKIELLVNIKVEKIGSVNDGIVAANILKKRYLGNSKPKLYLILKIHYSIDEVNSILKFNNLSSLYLESFISGNNNIKADKRNWSEKFNPLSGRLKSPNKKDLLKFGIQTIPEPIVIRKTLFNIEEKINK
jgi:hypothetical protein